MRAIKQNYIFILKLELEDLEQDIQELIEQWKRRIDENISQNTVMANLSLFQNELLGIGDFQRILDNIQTDDYETLADMILEIRRLFKHVLKTHGLAEAVWDCVDRKIRKVTKYVTNC